MLLGHRRQLEACHRVELGKDSVVEAGFIAAAWASGQRRRTLRSLGWRRLEETKPLAALSGLKSGFLSEENASRACLRGAVGDEVQGQALVEAKRLREVENPEERPFDSRYEERDLLGKVARQAAANAAAAEAEGRAAARRARVIEGRGARQRAHWQEFHGDRGARLRSSLKLEAAIAGLEGVAEESAAHVEVLIINTTAWACCGGPTRAAATTQTCRF
jgi:hypothetical protein